MATSPKRAALRNRAILRLSAAVVAGTVTGVVVTGNHGWAFRVVAGWDAGLIVLLALAWSIILRYTPEQTRRRAAAVDPGSTLVRALVLVSSTACLLAATAVVWMAVHTAFTFRYAHLYYGEGRKVGGLRFPDDAEPADIDFAYFAFTVGMCFGATDIFLTETRFRRATLGHALLSFFFNTGILAMTLNLILTGLT
jgi:uncharacterized membrane protein